MSEMRPAAAIEAALRRLVPLALNGLERMVCPDGRAFCHLARVEVGGQLRLEGRSPRYSAMSLIGLARHGVVAGELDTVADHLHAFAKTASNLGDAALVLWAELLRGDARAETTARSILRRRDEVFASKADGASMETGFLLTGLAQAMQVAVGGTALAVFAADVAQRLAANQHPQSHLFSFSRKLRRKNVHRARLDHRLGSFASQVYPVLGFADFARASHDERARDAALSCAARLCALQGDAGQWWWIYHVARGYTALRYPVYSVHQDAMGPMALYAAVLAADGDDRYDTAIARSFSWFETRPECRDTELVEPELGIVWRAVQHDEPVHTGRLGLGRAELSRLGRAAWIGRTDTRSLSPGFVCRECRPYHLGWILLAAALHDECNARRA